MAVPIIELYTEQWDTTGSTSLIFTKPSGVAVGELLLIIAINDDASAVAFTDGGKPSGWNFLWDFGDSTSDSHIGLFWRIADGTEGASETVTSEGDDNWGGWYVRISGVDTTTPINIRGTKTSGEGTSVTALAVTTTVDDCLALCFGAFDGGDGYPFTVSGTGWSKEDDGQSGTTGIDCSGVWGKKSMGAAGSTLNATIGASVSDGMVGAQIAIAPAAEGNVTVIPGVIAQTTTKYIPVLKLGLTPSTKTLASTKYIPVLGLGVTPSTLAQTTSLFAPVISITENVTITPEVLTQILTNYASVLRLGVIPTTTTLTSTKYAPVLGIGIIPATLALPTAKYAPVLGFGIIPSTLVLGTTKYIPVITVTSGENVIITPDVLALATTKYASVLKFGIIPSTLTLAITKYSPVLDTGVIPTLLALILTTYSPLAPSYSEVYNLWKQYEEEYMECLEILMAVQPEIEAIKTKVDKLPADPTSTSELATVHGAGSWEGGIEFEER